MTNENSDKIWNYILNEALSPKGSKYLSGENVKSMILFIRDKPYILGRVEAMRIEPVYDRDMPEYSLYGFVSTTAGRKADKRNREEAFLKLDEEAQKEEQYAIRYNIWIASYPD